MESSITAGMPGSPLSPTSAALVETVQGEFSTMREKFEKRSELRHESVKWEVVGSIASLPKDEIRLLDSLEKECDPVAIGTLVTGDRFSEAFALALVKVLSKVNSEGHIRKALLFVHDALHIPGPVDHQKSIDFLNLMIDFEVDLAESDGRDPFDALLKRHTTNQDMLIMELSSILLGEFLRNNRIPHVRVAESFMRYLIECLRGSDVNRIEVAAHALSSLTRCDAPEVYKQIFFRMDGFEPLFRALAKAYHAPQATYYLLLCIWLLSFSYDFVRAWQGEYHLVAVMHDYLRKSKKEKIIRMALLILQNVTKHDPRGNEYFDFLMDMITLGVNFTLEKLELREFSDPDIGAALEPLRKAMENDHPILTSFDDYRQEVLSGHLENSHCHKSEKFWRQNISKFEENDGVMLRQLRDLLRQEDDTQTLVIACQDIGNFVRYHPRGRKIMEDFGFKPFVMKLLSHPEEAVGKAALECMQKLLIKNWEFLARE